MKDNSMKRGKGGVPDLKVGEADKEKAKEMGRQMAMRDMAAKPGVGYGRPGGAVPPGLAKKPGMMAPGQFKRMPAPVAASPVAAAPVAPAPAVAAPVAPAPVAAAPVATTAVTPPKTMKSGGMVRGNGCAQRGHTKGRMI